MERPLLIVAVALLVSACGGVQAPPQVPPRPELVDRAGYAERLRSTHDELRWPADFRPDVDRLIEATAPVPDELALADNVGIALRVVNTCAWYLSWDAARQRPDEGAAASALKVMADDLTRFPPPDDLAGREFVRQVAERAEAGDPGLARDYVAANCASTAWR